MRYFFAGLWHFAMAMAFACALGALENGDLLLWMKRVDFLIPCLLTSSACFFVPDSWAKRGIAKFLHYPLPDWDVLLLGIASHRHWLTHSALLPILLLGLAVYFPFLQMSPTFRSIASGVGVGIGSHLFWDCVGSRTHKIVVVPHAFALREMASRTYLLAGAAISLGIAACFGLSHNSFSFDKMRAKTPISSTQNSGPNGFSLLLVAAPTMTSKSDETLKPQLVAKGVEFPEGISVAPDGTIFAVDIPTSRIVQVEGDKAVEWLNTSLLEKDGKPAIKGKPNGSKFRGNTLFVCDAGRKQLLAIAPDKRVRILADAAKGDLVNGPNDCDLDKAGNIYFTDPNYQKQKAGVYFSRLRSDGTYLTTKFADGFDFPNGVAVAPDGKSVFVGEFGGNRIWKVELAKSGVAKSKRVWCSLPKGGGPDGMRFDDKGRLFVAQHGGGKIHIVEPDGRVSRSLDAGGQKPTNVAFSHDFKTLYITETQTKAIYKIDISLLR